MPPAEPSPVIAPRQPEAGSPNLTPVLGNSSPSASRAPVEVPTPAPTTAHVAATHPDTETSTGVDAPTVQNPTVQNEPQQIPATGYATTEIAQQEIVVGSSPAPATTTMAYRW